MSEKTPEPGGLDIKKRSVTKAIQYRRDKDGNVIGEYKRYKINLPKKFVEEHNIKDLWLVADQMWFGLPDESSLLTIVALIPQIKDLLTRGKLTQEEISKILTLNPEIREFIIKEGVNHAKS